MYDVLLVIYIQEIDNEGGYDFRDRLVDRPASKANIYA